MSLADAANSRKERLLALRKRKANDLDQETEDNGEEKTIRLKQRNFDPETRNLRKRNGVDGEEDTVERNMSGVAEQIIADDQERRQEELDIYNIAPKKPNWDLKREMQKKLAKLDRKTTDAIHTLIRERVMAQKGGESDLVDALNAHEKGREAENEPMSDEEE